MNRTHMIKILEEDEAIVRMWEERGPFEKGERGRNPLERGVESLQSYSISIYRCIEIVSARIDLNTHLVRIPNDTCKIGGYVYVDDYFTFPGCRLAVDTFRALHKIVEPLRQVRETPGRFHKECNQIGSGLLACSMAMCMLNTSTYHVPYVETCISKHNLHITV